MQLLWRGIAAYVFHYDIEIMFGCASLPGVDPEALARMLNGAMIDAVLWIASSDNQAEAVKGASDAVVLLLDGLAAKA